MSASLELQDTILNALRDTPEIMALVNGVYDYPPRDCWAAPKEAFISFGPSDYSDDSAECVNGFRHTFQIDIWTRKVGYPLCKQVTDMVRRALHYREFDMTDNALVQMRVEMVRFLRDELTSHGVVMVSAFVDEPE